VRKLHLPSLQQLNVVVAIEGELEETKTEAKPSRASAAAAADDDSFFAEVEEDFDLSPPSPPSPSDSLLDSPRDETAKVPLSDRKAQTEQALARVNEILSQPSPSEDLSQLGQAFGNEVVSGELQDRMDEDQDYQSNPQAFPNLAALPSRRTPTKR